MTRPRIYWLMDILALAFAIGLSYLMALAKEPQALWLWRDILGVIQ